LRIYKFIGNDNEVDQEKTPSSLKMEDGVLGNSFKLNEDLDAKFSEILYGFLD